MADTLMKDSVLLERWVAAHDGEAFAELVQRYAGVVYGACRRVIRDHHTAEDVAQDCLLEFARKAASARSHPVGGFLYTIATRRARDRLRDDAVRRRNETAAGAVPGPGPDEADLTWRSLAPILDAAVAELPEEQRLPLVLHFLAGRSQAQVADELGCSQPTVSRRIADAVAALRGRLARAGFVGSLAMLSATLAAHGAEAAPPTLVAAAGKIAMGGLATTAAPAALATWSAAATALVALTLIALGGIAARHALRRPAPPPVAAPRWAHGLPSDPGFFPIGVWMQPPDAASRWKELGVNLYVNLWHGPDEAQLATLAVAGMPVMCHQNGIGLQHRDDATIVGWLADDEPDNARPRADGTGYDPPPAPDAVRAACVRVAGADATRPVVIVFGQGVAWDGDTGRGARTGHPEDYALYARAADIVAFHVYPTASRDDAVRDRLELVGAGAARLRGWVRPEQPVWAFIACGRADGARRPTAEELWSQAWSALANGASGLVWFAHELQPPASEHAPLDDAELGSVVQRIDRAIAAFAPVLNAPQAGAVRAEVASGADQVAIRAHRYRGDLWIIAAAMGARGVDATIVAPGCPAGARVEVVDENRALVVRDGAFSDRFADYAIHRYRVIGAGER